MIRAKSCCISLMLIASAYGAKGQFGNAIHIDSFTSQTVTQIGVADFNGDNAKDVLVSLFAWPEDHLYLYTAINDTSFTKSIIGDQDSLPDIWHFDIGDINQDDQEDILFSYAFSSKICWYENQGGEFILHVIDDSLDLTSRVLLRDINQDGLLDIISLQHVEIVIYFALSPGVFGERIVIHDGTEFYAITTGYFDNNSSLDIAVASQGFEVLLNDGTGEFTLTSQEGLHLVFGLQAADLDQDMDMDIAAYNSLLGIVFYANDGSGQFTVQDTLIESVDNFEQYFLEDLTCDGMIDLLATIPQQGLVTIVENLGEATFLPPATMHHEQGELLFAPGVGDLNRDGSQDILWGSKHLGAKLNLCDVSALPTPSLPGMLMAYPNPSDGRIIVENVIDQEIIFSIQNSMGQVIEVITTVAPQQKIELQLPGTGLYFLYYYPPGNNALAIKLIVNKS